jgi:TRAP-type mannitol/chloroaromatic compound transport system permease small subunit
MQKFLGAIDLLNEKIGKGVSYLIIFLLFVIIYEIICRYLFNNPTIWAHETSQMIYGAYVILLGGYVLQRGGHVNVEIIYGRFSPRQKAIIDLFTWLLFFYFCGLLLLKGGEMAWDSFKVRETEPTAFAPPVYPIKMTIPLGAFLLLLQGLAKFIRDLHLALLGKEVPK